MRHQVTLYSKAGCCLCDDAKALLDRLGRQYLFDLHEVDITTDPALFARYRELIPVVVVDDMVTVASRVDEARLRRAFRRGAERSWWSRLLPRRA